MTVESGHVSLKLHMHASVAHRDSYCAIFLSQEPTIQRRKSTFISLRLRTGLCGPARPTGCYGWAVDVNVSCLTLYPCFPLRCWPFRSPGYFIPPNGEKGESLGSVYKVTIFRTSDRPLVLCSAIISLSTGGTSRQVHYNDIGFTPDAPGRPRPPHTPHPWHGPIGDGLNGEDLPAMSFGSDIRTSCEPRSHRPMVFQCCLAHDSGKCPCPAL